MGLMGKRDFDNYYKFFETLKSMVQPPDLLIYLKASVPTLVGQIQKRGREYEENIRLDYLKKLIEDGICFAISAKHWMFCITSGIWKNCKREHFTDSSSMSL